MRITQWLIPAMIGCLLAAPLGAAAADAPTGGIKLVQIDSNAWYSLIAGHSRKVLQVAASGDALEQDTPTGADNQLFQFRQVTSGWFHIVVKSTGKVLEIKDGSLLDHARVQQADASDGENQLFALVEDSDGSWNIVAKSSGYCFDILGGVKAVDDHTPVIVYPAGNARNHKFSLVPAK